MLEDELTALWSKEVQRERDPAFELAVMRRMEQLVFRRTLALNVALIAAATVLLAFSAPALTAIWQETFGRFINAPGLACLFMIVSYALSRPRPKMGGQRACTRSGA